MRERELQDYIFNNPNVLFPGKIVRGKRREVFIEGRRIDLLFDVEGVHYIVELKADTIKRETVGQIFEYYALMRMSRRTADFKMILVAPQIPEFRRLPLEEFGIRCVEIQHPASLLGSHVELRPQALESKGQQEALSSTNALVAPARINLEDLMPPATSSSLRLANTLLRDGLLNIERIYPEFEVLPIRMNIGQDVLCFPKLADPSGRFVRGGAWWAYSFGHSEEMAKNDVPNISVCAQPWGLDFSINAELQTSQAVMRRKVAHSVSEFNALCASRPRLELQTWLKLEHQPRFYHWVMLERLPYGSWDGEQLLEHYRAAEARYEPLRKTWIGWIEEHQHELSPAQARHMNRTNRRLNLALRLVHSFGKNEKIWNLPYPEQQEYFGVEYARMKPLIDFFQRC